MNVVTHPRFNRPPVAQPWPRLRRGTISFMAHRRRVRCHARQAKRERAIEYAAQQDERALGRPVNVAAVSEIMKLQEFHHRQLMELLGKYTDSPPPPAA